MKLSRGIYATNHLLSSEERSSFQGKLERLDYNASVILSEHFQNHLHYAEADIPKTMKNDIVKFIASDTDFQNLFRPTEITRIFINRQITEENDSARASMDIHCDGPTGLTEPLVTWVLVIKNTKPKDGAVIVSTREDGRILDKSFSRSTEKIFPKDNSSYYFFGFHVSHGVCPLKTTGGWRFSVVVFLRTRLSMLQAMQKIAEREVSFICPTCGKLCATLRKFNDHKYNHKRVKKAVL